MRQARAAFRIVCIASALAMSAWAVSSTEAEANGGVGRAQEVAKAFKLAGKYYYRTDRFNERCMEWYFLVQTSWANDTTGWTSVPRGTAKYVKPAQAPNGSFEWHCGNVLINGDDHSECNNSPADYVRIYRNVHNNDIDMQCFNICGKGSKPADCSPF